MFKLMVLLYFGSSKCSLGKNKRFFKNILKNLNVWNFRMDITSDTNNNLNFQISFKKFFTKISACRD